MSGYFTFQDFIFLSSLSFELICKFVCDVDELIELFIPQSNNTLQHSTYQKEELDLPHQDDLDSVTSAVDHT